MGMTLLRAYDLAQHLSFPCHRLAAGMQVPVALRSTKSISVKPKGVAKKIKALAGLPQIQYASFVAVDLQAQPAFQFALNPAAQLGADVAGQHDKIVRVAHEFCLGPLRRSVIPLEQVVKPVQVDVGQQWAEDASLGRTSVVAPYSRRCVALRRFHHRRLEPLPDQSQNRAVHDPHAHASDELIVRDAVEISS
jgi:hypothetical protein